MRIIITGGSGLIGTALIEVLAARNHEIIVLSRRPALAARSLSQQPNTQAVGWDACTTGGWGHLITPGSAIVNLTGASPAHWRWTASHKARILQSRLSAIAALMEAIERYGPPEVLVQASASGYYDNRGNELLVESSPPGQGFRAEACQEIEAAVAAVSSRCCVARTGIVLDTHTGAFPPLLIFARLLGRQLGDGRQWIPWIHRRDVARAIEVLIERRSLSGAFNICAPAAATNREFLRAVRAELGRPGILPLPASALRALLGEEASVVLDSQCLLPQRLLENDFTFEYPQLDQALRQLLA